MNSDKYIDSPAKKEIVRSVKKGVTYQDVATVFEIVRSAVLKIAGVMRRHVLRKTIKNSSSCRNMFPENIVQATFQQVQTKYVIMKLVMTVMWSVPYF
uniref:HTH_Tnp_ISL3 domain-containing protein n=1 Tax=Heterorhabditis bacteriophora TaxID=37862 RepID=A0A1I7WSX0_HETBA